MLTTSEERRHCMADSSPRGLLILQDDMAEPELHAFGSGRAAVFSCRSPFKRTVNEDGAALIPFDGHRCVLAVADGAGGMKAGDQASNLALKRLRTAIRRAARSGNRLREAILDGIDRANSAVCALGGAATTLAVAEVDHRRLRTYHAGDSPIMVVGGRGLVKLKTVDHSPVGYAVESGIFDEREAMHHDYRHVISNFLGAHPARVEMGSLPVIAARDRVLLASDGLFDNLFVDEIADIIHKGRIHTAARELAALARERMQRPAANMPSKPDDLTFILFRPGRRRRRSARRPRRPGR